MRILPHRLRVQALLLVAVGLGGAIIVAAAFAPARATPSASPFSSATAAATTGTFQTASPIAVAPAPLVVYYARQGLPPFRATALGGAARAGGAPIAATRVRIVTAVAKVRWRGLCNDMFR